MRVKLVVPCHNEAAVVRRCIASILGQGALRTGRLDAEVVVVANGCTDDTAEIARSLAPRAATLGVGLTVIDTATRGKSPALSAAGDSGAAGWVYVDADVVLDPDLLGQLAEVLDAPEPRYASGVLRVAPPRCWISRCYRRIWTRLPFVAQGVPGCGLYAVNAAGRRRWGRFPAIHSDDKFVRLLFRPEERFRVAAGYEWPLPEGLRNLVRVRRRWCEGNIELGRAFPGARRNDDSRAVSLRHYAGLFARRPISFTAFSTVFAVSLGLAWTTGRRDVVEWRRGR